jgi:hypothetical protein
MHARDVGDGAAAWLKNILTAIAFRLKLIIIIGLHFGAATCLSKKPDSFLQHAFSV